MSAKSLAAFIIGMTLSISVGLYSLISSKENVTQKQISQMQEFYDLNREQSSGKRLSQIPQYLFDIRLQLDQTVISKEEELMPHVSFISFGTLPTPVDMTFAIIDSQEQIIHEESNEITVETESVYMKRFENLKLKPGLYTLKLKTVYGNNVEDEFSQEFEVKRKKFLGIF